MCAIAFRGGLGNKEINSLFAGDAGDCLGAVDYECVRGIASAAAEGVNSHHSGTYEPGDVEDACLSMNEIAIPESCSNAAVTGELWKDPIAKCNVPHLSYSGRLLPSSAAPFGGYLDWLDILLPVLI